MATFEQELEARTELENVLGELAAIDIARLARKDLGAFLDFESGVSFCSRSLQLFRTLREVDLENISWQRATQLTALAKQTRDQIRQIQEFSLQKYPNDPVSQRDSILNQVRDAYDNLFESVTPTIAYAIRKGTDFQRLEEQAKDQIKRIEILSKEHQAALKSAQSDAEQVMDEVRKIAQEAGVTQHAIHFKNEADQSETASQSWLKATIVLAIFTLLVGVAMLFMYAMGMTEHAATLSLQFAIAKIAIFSILISATFWTGRSYKALRHNAVVNRHRQNALATFQAFAQATSDDQTKNAVLLQATQCIFSPQQTGYVPGEPDGPGASQVLEIIRNVGK